MKASFFLACTLLVVASASASTSLPSPPFLKRAPSFAKWSITYQFNKAAPAEASASDKPKTPDYGRVARPKKEEVTKTGTVYHDVTIDENGGRKELWSNGKLQVIRLPDSPDPVLEDMNAFAVLGTNFNAHDFPSLLWISAAKYVQTISDHGVDYLVFKNDNGAVAYINVDTRLPFQVISDEGREVYRFEDGPSEMQRFPADFQKPVDARNQALKALTKAPPRPF